MNAVVVNTTMSASEMSGRRITGRSVSRCSSANWSSTQFHTLGKGVSTTLADEVPKVAQGTPSRRATMPPARAC